MSQTITFDTHKFIKTLKEAGLSDELAEAHAEALKEAHASQSEDLATKGGLREMEARVIGEIRLVKWMLALVIAATVLPIVKNLFTP
ncbi:MAG: DUF1640 domain-containing protein [Magnetococcales bacterium]|nr:DUF1640 domain-containing protein [Magnetococcales bacterium]